MKYVAKATIKNKVTAEATLKNKIVASVHIKTLSPDAQSCPEYNLIDGGAPNTNYAPINGFNLIDGGII